MIQWLLVLNILLLFMIFYVITKVIESLGQMHCRMRIDAMKLDTISTELILLNRKINEKENEDDE